MKRSGPIPRRTPLRQVGARKLRTLEAERSFRQQVRVNAGNWCQLQTPACLPYRHEGHHAHHLSIADRRLGVHDPARGRWVCFPSHRYLHMHPEEAYANGWLLRAES